jgi:hypothetical protein
MTSALHFCLVLSGNPSQLFFPPFFPVGARSVFLVGRRVGSIWLSSPPVIPAIKRAPRDQAS